MTDDLDNLAQIARDARDGVGGDWTVDKMTTEECAADGVPNPLPWNGYFINAREGVIVADAELPHDVAQHIAAFSPEVALRLIERVRILETTIQRIAMEAPWLVTGGNK